MPETPSPRFHQADEAIAAILAAVAARSAPLSALLATHGQWAAKRLPDGRVVALLGLSRPYLLMLERQAAKLALVRDAVAQVLGVGLEVCALGSEAQHAVPLWLNPGHGELAPSPEDKAPDAPTEDLPPPSIRHTWLEGERWFSVVDVVGYLTGSTNGTNYWSQMLTRARREQAASGEESQLLTVCQRLKLVASDGKQRLTDCATTEGLLRIVQSIPSNAPKVEALKAWLAQVGADRIQEEANPELAAQRAAQTWRRQGRDEAWIRNRMRSLDERRKLTDEWGARGISEGRDFGTLTAILGKETFGVAPKEHKAIKGLARENLRDHMSGLELALQSVAEAAATELHQVRDSQGLQALSKDAQEAGQIAGRTRRDLEDRLGRPVVTGANHLPDANPRARRAKGLPQPPEQGQSPEA